LISHKGVLSIKEGGCWGGGHAFSIDSNRFVGELEMQKQRLLGFLLPARQVSTYGTACWAKFSLTFPN
jgi:hypothetical protein